MPRTEGNKRQPIQQYPTPQEVDINRMVQRLMGFDYTTEAIRAAWQEFVMFMPRLDKRALCGMKVYMNHEQFRQFFELRLALLERKIVRPNDSISGVLNIVINEFHEVLFKTPLGTEPEAKDPSKLPSDVCFCYHFRSKHRGVNGEGKCAVSTCKCKGFGLTTWGKTPFGADPSDNDTAEKEGVKQ